MMCVYQKYRDRSLFTRLCPELRFGNHRTHDVFPASKEYTHPAVRILFKKNGIQGRRGRWGREEMGEREKREGFSGFRLSSSS
jgi:hypothetical protein